MKIKNKSILISLVLNILFSIIMSIININIGLLVMIAGVIVLPILINIVAFKASKENYRVSKILIMSIFNIIYYIIVAKSIMHNPKFFETASKYSHEENGFYIQMNTNLLSLSQIAFLFLLYFVMSFLIIRIILKKVN